MRRRACMHPSLGQWGCEEEPGYGRACSQGRPSMRSCVHTSSQHQSTSSQSVGSLSPSFPEVAISYSPLARPSDLAVHWGLCLALVSLLVWSQAWWSDELVHDKWSFQRHCYRSINVCCPPRVTRKRWFRSVSRLGLDSPTFLKNLLFISIFLYSYYSSFT